MCFMLLNFLSLYRNEKQGKNRNNKTYEFPADYSTEIYSDFQFYIFKYLRCLDIGIPYMKFIRTFPFLVNVYVVMYGFHIISRINIDFSFSHSPSSFISFTISVFR